MAGGLPPRSLPAVPAPQVHLRTASGWRQCQRRTHGVTQGLWEDIYESYQGCRLGYQLLLRCDHRRHHCLITKGRLQSMEAGKIKGNHWNLEEGSGPWFLFGVWGGFLWAALSQAEESRSDNSVNLPRSLLALAIERDGGGIQRDGFAFLHPPYEQLHLDRVSRLCLH